jgi:hypothetical protein
MLHDIEPDDRDNSKKLMICTSFALRKLYLNSLADLLGCQSSATISEEQATLDEIAICAPILQLRGQAVEFVHQSARDYLLRDQPDHDPVLEAFRIKPEEGHLYMTQRCLRSLAEGTYLHHYSLLNWPKHAKHLEKLAPYLLAQEHSFFGISSDVRDTWWRKYSGNFQGLPDVIPPRLHIACFIGLKTWARAILLEGDGFGKSRKDVIAERCAGGWLALDYAAEGAAEDLVDFLFDESSSEYKREQLDCALRRAVLAQRGKPVRLLLGLGANANGTGIGSESLLRHAIESKSWTIEHLLLKHGACPCDPVKQAIPHTGRMLRSNSEIREAYANAALPTDWVEIHTINIIDLSIESRFPKILLSSTETRITRDEPEFVFY